MLVCVPIVKDKTFESFIDIDLVDVGCDIAVKMYINQKYDGRKDSCKYSLFY